MLTQKNKLAAMAVGGVAALALLGGSLAQLTDRDATAPQVLTAGTIQVGFDEGAEWITNLSNLAIDDTVERTVSVVNEGSLPVANLSLTPTVESAPGPFGGDLSEATRVSVTAPGGAVIPRSFADPLEPSGFGFTTLASAEAGGWVIPLASPLRPGERLELSFAYEVYGDPQKTTNAGRGARETTENSDNVYQGSSAEVTYTLDAIQRAGRHHSVGGEEEDDGSNPTPVSPLRGAIEAVVAGVQAHNGTPGSITQADVEAFLPASFSTYAALTFTQGELNGTDVTAFRIEPHPNGDYTAVGEIYFSAHDASRPLMASGFEITPEGNDFTVYGKSSYACQMLAMNAYYGDVSSVTEADIEALFGAVDHEVSGSNPWTVEFDSSSVYGPLQPVSTCELEAANGLLYVN